MLKYISILLILILSFSVIQMAYADSLGTGVITRNKDGSNNFNTCGGIALLPVDASQNRWIIVDCDNTTATATVNVYGFNSTARQSSVTYTQTSGDNLRTVGFPINSHRAVFQTGCITASCTLFRQFDLTNNVPPIISATTTFAPSSCTPLESSAIQLGTNIYFACTNGNIREFNPITFTQTNSWTGLTSGLPTCTTLRAVTFTSVSNNLKGVAICDTDTMFAFDMPSIGGAITKGASSVTATDSWNAGNINPTGIISGTTATNTYVYFTTKTPATNRNTVASFNTSTLVLGTPQNFATNAEHYTDIRVARGGYYMIPMSNTANQILILNTTSAPPNNFVGTLSTGGNRIDVGAQMSSSDGTLFALSKGSGANNTMYIYSLDMTISLSSDNGGGGGHTVGGVDCTLPQFEFTVRCRAGGNGTNTFPSVLLANGTGTLICQTGLLEFHVVNGNCVLDNPDMKTNGVGYLMTAVAIGIFVGILWVASRGQLTEIPTFIWFVGTIAILGAVTAFGWIDPTFLIIGVIAIVGMAVAKVKGVFGGNTLFAGEAS